MILGNTASTPDDGKGWFVGRGTRPCTAMVDGRPIELVAGSMLVVEPGEAHTFVRSSDDYLHFVVRTPFVKGDKIDLVD